jgi:hypothetical protein
MSATLLLCRLICRLPEGVLEKYTEFLFLPLLARLVNDESAACRKMVGLLLGSLVKHTSKAKKDALIDMVCTLCGSGEMLRRRAAAQALGIMIEQLGDATERYADKLLGVVSSSVKTLVRKSNDEWEVVYYLLLATEKLLRGVPKLPERGDLAALSAMVQQSALLHKHAWVRLSASRVMGTLFTAGAPRVAKLLQMGGGGFAVVKALCGQLAAPNLDERLGEQVCSITILLCKRLGWFILLFRRNVRNYAGAHTHYVCFKAKSCLCFMRS